MANRNKKPPPEPTGTLVIRYAEADSLHGYGNNPRTHSGDQVSQIARSIEQFGFVNPILLDKTGTIIAGHGRLAAAKLLGRRLVPVIDLDELTPEQARALVIADNKLALNAGWDEALLAAELKAIGDLADYTGFTPAELDAYLNPPEPGLTDPDEIPETPANPVSIAGDHWRLGAHSLVCGDCTSEADVGLVMDGAPIAYVFTSPPYGIDLGYEKDASLGDLAQLIADTIAMVDRFAAPDAYATMNYADVFRQGDPGFTPMTEHYYKPFAMLGWVLRGNRIWFKPFGRLSLSYGTSTTMNLREWEYVQTWRKGRGKENLREHGMTLRGVWKTFGDDAIIPDWKKYDVTTDKEVHPAAFPVVLPVTGIRCYSDPGAHVFEPFSGSGTSIIAAEMTGRICHALEIAPAYVDVAVARWQAFTGKDATCAKTGQTFQDMKRERLGPKAA